MNPGVLPDVLEMPVKREYGAVVFLRYDRNIAVRQVDVFPLPP